jgi:hypothetical protein
MTKYNQDSSHILQCKVCPPKEVFLGGPCDTNHEIQRQWAIITIELDDGNPKKHVENVFHNLGLIRRI